LDNATVATVALINVRFTASCSLLFRSSATLFYIPSETDLNFFRGRYSSATNLGIFIGGKFVHLFADSVITFVDWKFFLQIPYARFDPINQFGERQTGFIDPRCRCRAKSDIRYENRDCPQSFHRHGSRSNTTVSNTSINREEIISSRIRAGISPSRSWKFYYCAYELISCFFFKRKIYGKRRF